MRRALTTPHSAVWLLAGFVGLASGVIAQTVPSEPAPATGLALVLAEQAEAPFPARLQAVRALSKTLSSNEVQALYALLNRKNGEDPAAPGERNALKNDVVNILRGQQTLPSDLPVRLMAMFNDPTHDAVWRDYCIQHLGVLYPDITPPARQTEACTLLWSAAAEKPGSIPGTALIALANLCGRPGFEKARITALALSMVRAPDYGEPAKITAFQICAKLGETAVLADARQCLADGSVMLRVSALACVGLLGDASDLPAVRAAEASTDIRLHTAAAAALKRLQAKSSNH